MSVTPNPATSKLKKVLGLGFGIAIAVGGTIGVGILRTPGNIAALIPDYWLILACWITGGLFMMITAISYAELGSMLPKAGGAYNFVKLAYGSFPGFITGWFDFIVNTIAPAYFSIVISEYFLLLFPGISIQQNIIAITFLSFFTAINLPSVKTGSILQQATTLLKVIIFAIIIIGSFLYGNAGGPALPKANAAIASGMILPFFMALQFIMGTYDGWWSIIFFSEEDKNPGNNIPRSLFISTSIILIVYVLINAAVFLVVPVEQAANSPLVASDAAKIIFGPSGSTVLTAFALLSLISILNAYMMIPSRIIFALSRDGFFFKQAAFVNKGGSPAFALMICYIIQVFLILASSFEDLFALGAYLSLYVVGISLFSMMRLRKTQPDLPRPFRAYAYPYSTLLSIIMIIGLFIAFAFNDQKSILVMASLVAIGYPVYYLVVRRGRGQK